jgi:uncharacterized membrane protein
MKLGAAFLAAMLLFAATPADAALTLCNRTSYVLYAATAAIKSPQAQTQGWTRIAPGDCQVARKEDLTAETYLVHARSSLAHSGPARAWGGNFPMCVRDTNFTLSQSVTMAACSTEGTFALPFATLDTGGRNSWTMTLDEQPGLPTLPAAQLAGAKRLLRDNGYEVGPIDAAVSRQTGTALAAFRRKMNFAPQAGNTELFLALENEARKRNSPAGYTACNDGKTVLEVALAEVDKGKPASRGWWTVAPGACARLRTTALATGNYFLLARRKDGTVVAGGPEKFCIAPTAFEIRERGNCASRRQTEAGFVPTQTGGQAGFTARIGDKGLIAPSAGAQKAK